MANNIYTEALSRLDLAASYAETDTEVVENSKHSKLCMKVCVPVRMDDGSLKIFDGFRVHSRHTLLFFRSENITNKELI